MKFVLLLILLFANTFLLAQLDLEITVTGLKEEGVMMMGIYNSTVDFMEEKGMYRQIIEKVDGDSFTLTINDLPPGEYALSFFVDSNGNGEMDYNFFGMPKEQYGFYTDPGMIFSEPSFSDISFTIKGDEKIKIVAR